MNGVTEFYADVPVGFSVPMWKAARAQGAVYLMVNMNTRMARMYYASEAASYAARRIVEEAQAAHAAQVEAWQALAEAVVLRAVMSKRKYAWVRECVEQVA